MIDTTFIDDLASAAPTPGGGGASAYGGALAAALASMVANLTVGKKTYADVEDDMYAALEKLTALRERFVELIQEDADAFEPLAAAYRMPKATEEEQAAKTEALQKALVAASEVPLEIMRTTMQLFDLCEFLAEKGSRMVVSDAGVAVVFARAALTGAAYNVYINLGSLRDAERANAYREETDAMLKEGVARADRIYQYVMNEVSPA